LVYPIGRRNLGDDIMTVQIIANEHRQIAVDIVMPDAQVGTNDPVVLTGSELDMRMWSSLAYTILCADQTITWWVYAANQSDYSDEVIVDGPSDVLAAAVDSYAVAQAPYAYYRLKFENKVDDVVGTATGSGIAKG
jgi:hypothetical protein